MKVKDRVTKVQILNVLTFKSIKAICESFGEDPGELENLWLRVASRFESLPIETDGIVDYRWMGFVLSGGVWFPCHVMVIDEWQGQDIAHYRIDYTDGSQESGIALWGSWAHCTADDQPSLPLEL